MAKDAGDGAAKLSLSSLQPACLCLGSWPAPKTLPLWS